MWNHRSLSRIDFRTLPILIGLMLASLLVISSTTCEGEDIFLTQIAKTQLRWFGVGWLFYLFFAGIDYHKLREWAWILYVGMAIVLFGLFFTTPIQNVQRWYRIPFLGFAFQPSEYAKLIVVIALSWFIEYKGQRVRSSIAA